MRVTCAALVLGVFFGALAASATADPLEEFLYGDTEALARSLAESLPEPPPLAWLVDPQLRVSPEIDANDKRTDTYSLRVRPTGRKERAATRNLLDIENQLTVARWDRALSETLAVRYHLVIDLALSEARLALAQERAVLEQSVLGAEQSLSATDQFSTARAATAASRVAQSARELRQLRMTTEALRAATVAGTLGVARPGAPQISARLATPPAIATALEAVTGSRGLASHDSAIAQLELARTRQEIALEHSRAKLGVDLAEISYENKGVDSYNLTLGVRLPFAQRKPRVHDALRRQADAQHRADLQSRRMRALIDEATRELKALHERHVGMRHDLDDLARRLAQPVADATAPALIRREQLRLLAAANQTHAEMLHGYVDVLDRLGQLQRRPLRNWIRGEPR